MQISVLYHFNIIASCCFAILSFVSASSSKIFALCWFACNKVIWYWTFDIFWSSGEIPGIYFSCGLWNLTYLSLQVNPLLFQSIYFLLVFDSKVYFLKFYIFIYQETHNSTNNKLSKNLPWFVGHEPPSWTVTLTLSAFRWSLKL